jgi:MFS family permease
VALGYAAGQLVAGRLSDRSSRELVGSVAAALLASSLLCLSVVSSPEWAAFALAIALGAAGGGLVGTGSAAVGDLFAGKRLGRMSAFVQIAGASGAALGAWFGGFGFDLTGGYEITFRMAAACVLLWVPSIWLAAPRRSRSLVTAEAVEAG